MVPMWVNCIKSGRYRHSSFDTARVNIQAFLDVIMKNWGRKRLLTDADMLSEKRGSLPQ